MLKTFFFASGLLIAGFCHHTHAAPLTNLSTVKHQLIEYHDNGSYQHDIEKIAKQIKTYLKKRIAVNQARLHKQKLAIVLDIDETVLSNYPQMKQRDFGGPLSDFDRDIEMGIDKPIIPMLKLYTFAKKNHIALFFVTGRKEHERQVTIDNLKNAGFDGWKQLMLKPESYHQASVVPYKAGARQKITLKGYTIVASIGDQVSDFKGGFTEKGFKLPNPYYNIP